MDERRWTTDERRKKAKVKRGKKGYAEARGRFLILERCGGLWRRYK
jgi:hypothetical protein